MSRRWRGPYVRRGRFLYAPPAQQTAQVPPWAPAFVEGQRPRALWLRRGPLFPTPPPPAAPATPAAVPGFIRRVTVRLVQVRRRGEFTWTPPQAAAPAAPPWTPGTVSRSRLRPAGGRRGTFLPAPPAGTAPVPGYLSARRPRPPRGRRSDYFTPTPAPTGPAPLVQAPYKQPARRMIPARRGVFARIAPAGVAPTAPAWVPAWLSRRATRVAAVRRGRIAAPALQQAQAAAWPVPIIQPRRRRLLPIRGGGFTTTAPAAHAGPPVIDDITVTVGAPYSQWAVGAPTGTPYADSAPHGSGWTIAEPTSTPYTPQTPHGTGWEVAIPW